MFTLKFYRQTGGFEVRQASRIKVQPTGNSIPKGDTVVSAAESDHPTHRIEYEDGISNAICEEWLGYDPDNHFDSMIVENIHGKTTQIVRVD